MVHKYFMSEYMKCIMYIIKYYILECFRFKIDDISDTRLNIYLIQPGLFNSIYLYVLYVL